MKVTVIKAFPYAHDGVHTVMMEAGEGREVRDDLVPGLTAAGYLAALAGKALPAAPENAALRGPAQNKALFETMALNGGATGAPSALAAGKKR